MVDMKTD